MVVIFNCYYTAIATRYICVIGIYDKFYAIATYNFVLLQGFVNPACHVLLSRWAVATDKGKFSGALMGGSIGIFIAWTLCGILIERFGWEWGFYFFGLLCFVLVMILWFLVYDSPEKHPRISLEEKKYLCENIAIQRRKVLK